MVVLTVALPRASESGFESCRIARLILALHGEICAAGGGERNGSRGLQIRFPGREKCGTNARFTGRDINHDGLRIFKNDIFRLDFRPWNLRMRCVELQCADPNLTLQLVQLSQGDVQCGATFHEPFERGSGALFLFRRADHHEPVQRRDR